MERQRRKREAAFVGDKNTGGKRSKRGCRRTGREEEPKV